MRNSEWGDSNALCCCEYYNIEEERSHILGCCCNCQALDEGFDNLISGQRIPPHKKEAVMAVFQDRIRIPWRGGAVQVSPHILAPVILVPAVVLLAALNVYLTAAILLAVPPFLNWFRTNNPRSNFFFSWGIVSFVLVSMIFEFQVISLLEIFPEENIAVGILTTLFICCAFRAKINARWQEQTYTELPNAEEQIGEDSICTICRKKNTERMYHCDVCQVCVPERDLHFVWLDCCIGSRNNGMFILTLIFAIAALLYSSNLTLTSVCHPYVVFWTVLLPDDCSDVYDEYDFAVMFVTGLYSLLIALYLLWVLLRQVLSISLGLTGQEWRQLPLSERMRFGLKSKRPYNQGFFRNWLRILRTKKNKSAYIST